MHAKPNAYFEDPTMNRIVAIRYRFKQPAMVTIRDVDGAMILVGYGIGDDIQIMEPDLQNLACRHEKYVEIPLVDGSHIVKFGFLDLDRVSG